MSHSADLNDKTNEMEKENEGKNHQVDRHFEFSSTKGIFKTKARSEFGENSQSSGVEVRTCVCACGNLSTIRGRRNNAILILAMATIPVLALILQNVIIVQTHTTQLTNSLHIKEDVLFSTQFGNVIHYMQIERGTSALYISSLGNSTHESLRNKRQDTDKAIQSLTQWIGTIHDGPQFFSKDAFHQSIRDFRKLVTILNVSVSENVQFYTTDIVAMIQWVASSVQKYDREGLWPMLVSYHMLVVSKEQAGLERALGSTFYAQGHFTSEQTALYLEKMYLGESYFLRFQQYVEGKTQIDRNYQGSALKTTIESMRETIMANVKMDPNVEMGQWWFDNMTSYINILKATQDDIAGSIVDGLDREIDQQEGSLVMSICIMSGAVLLLFLVIISVHRLTKRLQSFAVTLQEKTVALNIERKRSENLLNELMPANVAQKLMANLPVEPESFQAVTIFFSDIVGFTSISSRSSPLQVIDMLNILYKTFDQTLDLYNVYKVETIGDAYMIASGLPVRNEEGHAVEMAELALELRDTICNMAVPHLPDHLVQIRIGLNSGSVVSGVVGYKMPRYCLFGDTVNVASRMESSGLPSKIQISQSTHQDLTRHESFVMEQRGEVEIKGKGRMVTYILVGKASFKPRREVTYDTFIN